MMEDNDSSVIGYDYTAYVDLTDLNVRCPRKAVRFNHSLWIQYDICISIRGADGPFWIKSSICIYRYAEQMSHSGSIIYIYIYIYRYMEQMSHAASSTIYMDTCSR